jgi:hypothetical protein
MNELSEQSSQGPRTKEGRKAYNTPWQLRRRGHVSRQRLPLMRLLIQSTYTIHHVCQEERVLQLDMAPRFARFVVANVTTDEFID